MILVPAHAPREELTMGTEPRPRRSLPEIVATAGLAGCGLLVLVISVFESPPITADNPWPAIGDAFGLLFLAAAFLVWRGIRAGFVVGIVLSGVFLALFGPADVQDSLTGFADLGAFLQGLVLATALAISLIYSVMGARAAWRRGAPRQQARTLPASASLAVFALGFVIGGALIGLLASGVEARLLAYAGSPGDVVILAGASEPTRANAYSPETLTVEAGTKLTWVNKDTVAHTVTSQGTSLYDSGNMATGATFSYTFARAGTYPYFCTVHPWMKGTVIAR